MSLKGWAWVWIGVAVLALVLRVDPIPPLILSAIYDVGDRLMSEIRKR